MIQQLSSLVVLPDQTQFPVHTQRLTTVDAVPGNLTPSSDILRHGTYEVHRYTFRQALINKNESQKIN